jgi:hypothetical protein
MSSGFDPLAKRGKKNWQTSKLEHLHFNVSFFPLSDSPTIAVQAATTSQAVSPASEQGTEEVLTDKESVASEDWIGKAMWTSAASCCLEFPGVLSKDLLVGKDPTQR